jgi:hypothetical protein
MKPLTGLRARQAVSISSALTIALLLPGAVLAQDETPAQGTEPATADADLAKPGKFKAATVPKGKKGQEIGGVIAGGPGFIAVGGGSNDGMDQEAIIWVSDDGLRWQSVPLFGDAAKGRIKDIAATPVGYIAVGNDYVKGRENPAQALVWRSDDGLVWERVPEQDGFAGSIMTDVSATPDGAVAVGCRSDLQCMAGAVWHTSDGETWELGAELPMALPMSVAQNGVTTVTGGVDEVIDYGHDRAVLATSADGSEWALSDPLAEPQSAISDLALRGDAFLAVGSEWLLGADKSNSVLHSSPDGQDWTALTTGKLNGLQATAIGSSGELTIVAGTRNGATKPSIVWSHDLESFKEGGFAKKAANGDLVLAGVTVDHHSGLAVVVGSHRYRPVIWVSQLQ